MKQSTNIDHYKKKIIKLADKLLEKEKECSYLKELLKVHENRIINLEKQLNDDKRYKDLIEHIEQQDNKITSLIKERDDYKDLFESSDKLATEKQFEINGLTGKFSEILDRCFHAEKQRDNYKNDYEYAEECFQAERNRRWELEEQLNKVKEVVKDKNEFYEKCPLKVLHVDTENDIIKSRYTLDCFEILCDLHDCYQLFYLINKRNGRSVDFACICGPLVSTKEFELFDQFLDEEILMIERRIDKLNEEYKRYYIDLREFKFYETEFKLRNARKQKKNG